MRDEAALITGMVAHAVLLAHVALQQELALRLVRTLVTMQCPIMLSLTQGYIFSSTIILLLFLYNAPIAILLKKKIYI